MTQAKRNSPRRRNMSKKIKSSTKKTVGKRWITQSKAAIDCYRKKTTVRMTRRPLSARFRNHPIVLMAMRSKGKSSGPLDLMKPVKPLTAFQLYRSSLLVSILKKHPKKSMREIRQVARSMWRDLDQKSKDACRVKAAVEWADYQDLRLKWEPTEDPETLARRKLEGPVRFVSPYVFFATVHFRLVLRAHPNMNFRQVNQYLSCMWTKMNNRVKANYYELSLKDNQRWRKEMSAYQRGMFNKNESVSTVANRKTAHGGVLADCQCVPTKKYKKRRRKRTKEELQLQMEMPRKPTSGFGFYVSAVFPAVRKQNSNMSFHQLMHRMGCMWAREKDRSVYIQKAQQDRVRWEKEMKMYEEGTFDKEGVAVEEASPKKKPPKEETD